MYIVEPDKEEESYLTEKNNMKKLINLSTGMTLSKMECNALNTCEVCLEAKQTRLPFNTVRQRKRKTNFRNTAYRYLWAN